MAGRPKILGYPTVEHKITSEVALVGRYGEIWPDQLTGCYRAVIRNTKIAKKFRSDLKFKKHDELVVEIRDRETLKSLVEGLRIFRSPKSQIKYANEYC
jgi:hypothetical protein